MGRGGTKGGDGGKGFSHLKVVNVGDEELGEKVDSVGEVETAIEVVSLLILM